MATTIITKNGSGAPAAGDLVQGELAVDLTNQTLYSKDSSGNVFKVGDTGGGSPGTFTDLVATDSFTSPGIDDNATSTAITIDSSENVGIGTNAPSTTLDVNGDVKFGSGNSFVTTTNIFKSGGSAGIDGAYLRAAISGAPTPTYANSDDTDTGMFFPASNQLGFTTGGSEAVRIDTSGNVGIGTSAPDAALEISTVGSGLTNALKVTTTGTSTNPAILFESNAFGTQHTPARIRTQQNSSSEGGLIFETEDSGSLSEALRIDSDGNVGIGTDSPDSQLHVKNENGSGIIQLGTAGGTVDREWKQLASASNGSYIIQDTTAGINRLTVDAAGTTTVTGGFEAAQPGAGTGAFAAGDGAGVTNQGPYSVAVGTAAGQSNQSSQSVAIGVSAGTTSQGASTVAIGNLAGNNTQGASGIAIGWESASITQGSDGVAIGRNAGQTTQGAYSVAVGRDSGFTGQDQNAVAIGVNAGKSSQGNSGVAIGNGSGFSNQSDYSTAVGVLAGETNQAESAVAVGDQAGRTTQGVSAVAIGRLAGATSQGERAVAIGNGSGLTGQGNNSIAIGQDAGKTNQGANGIIISSQGTAQQSTGANHIVLRSPTGLLAYNGTNAWTLDGGGVVVPNGDLMVGTTSPDVITNKATGIRLEGSLGTANLYSNTRTCLNLGRANNGVMMQFYINGANTSGGISTTQGGTPVFFASSDERLKDNIVDHESELANVMSLRPTRWDWKKDEQGSGEGFIAQELEQTAWSDLVAEGEDGFKTVAGLGAVETRLIKAMQEQQVMIETLQAEVAALKGA